MKRDLQPFLAVRVGPVEMVRFVQALMSSQPGGRNADVSATLAERQWGDDAPVVRAARLRWDALNHALGDARVSSWTMSPQRDHIYLPAALIAAAGVVPLKIAADEVVFDIPTLLDATLQLCEPVGHG
jgi:hypothetical protein